MITRFNGLSSYNQAVLQLVLAGSIWGLSFICVLWALKDFSTSTLIFWRFLFAFIIGEIAFYFYRPKDFNPSSPDIKLSLFAGISLGLSLLLQTHGLNFTTATKSSFITSLYVILIPFAGYLFYKKQIKISHIVCGAIAFLGMAFLLNLHTETDLNFNTGDLLTFGCAITSTFHIMFVGAAANKVQSGFRFNTYQTFWSLMITLPFLIYEMQTKNISLWPANVEIKSVLSILFLSVFVSLIAFTLQVKAQKTLTNTTASLLCLLEAPNAFMFAFLILGEKLIGYQVLGIVLILGSSFLSVFIDRPKNRSS